MAGDMTNLYVKSDSTGMLSFTVDRFAVPNLLADGGRSVIVHADPDNFRNIPGRYGVTPDEGRTAVATVLALYASSAAGGARMTVR